MNKQEYREQVQQELRRMSEAVYFERSQQIHHLLLNEPSIKEGKTIALTISVFPEVDTRKLIETLWSAGKRVVAPKCIHRTREMDFYEITSFDQLKPAPMGLLEPDETLTHKCSMLDIDVCIVPGIVFDQRGYRIGYGGGYYDRFLPLFKGTKLSIAFNEQLVEEVPFEKHDIAIDTLITDQTRLDFSERG